MSELKVEKHKIVSFTFSFLDEKGNVLEQNENPVDYVHGAGEDAFPAVMTEALEGSVIGETKEILLPPELGFGAYDENKTYRAKNEDVPVEYQKIGAEVTFQNQEGDDLRMTVMSIEDDGLFLDGNHPFAGKTLTVKMTVTGIRDATVQEVGSGVPEKYQQMQAKNKKMH